MMSGDLTKGGKVMKCLTYEKTTIKVITQLVRDISQS